jgi:ABC-type amino acid transport system permease subunit
VSGQGQPDETTSVESELLRTLLGALILAFITGRNGMTYARLLQVIGEAFVVLFGGTVALVIILGLMLIGFAIWEAAQQRPYVDAQQPPGSTSGMARDGNGNDCNSFPGATW